MSTYHDLTYDQCLELLRGQQVGRLAMVADDQPIILPVNYRVVQIDSILWIAIRTRPGNELDQPGVRCAFEIDGYDTDRRRGWSVLVRGTLQRVDPDAAGFRERFDPEPWLAEDRESWLVVEAYRVTGREVTGTEPAWAFVTEAYL